jgi:signal peptidase
VKVASWLVALLFLTVGVDVAVAGHVSPAAHLAPFGHPVLSVASGSMAPTIRTGDLINDDPVPASQTAHLTVGQIISFTVAAGKGRRVFTHRIVAVNTGAGGRVTYTTKGDANDAPDMARVAPADVIGYYRWKIPDGGYALRALRQPLVIALLLFLTAVVPFVVGPARRPGRRLPTPVTTRAGQGASKPNHHI